ncbi:hypothetical protein DFH28DRAFT_1122011 [Melampsora americana]|nr:hypothetical protein DFH28DRAFT_1122011 [Melampsora americana]
MRNFTISKFKVNPNTPEAQAWFNRLDPRSKSYIYPHNITHQAHPCVRVGLDQCFGCGGFGHRRLCNKGGAMTFQHWRITVNGKAYSQDVLDMSDQDLATANKVINAAGDIEDTPFTLTQEDVLLLDAIENTASNNSPDPDEREVERKVTAIHVPEVPVESETSNIFQSPTINQGCRYRSLPGSMCYRCFGRGFYRGRYWSLKRSRARCERLLYGYCDTKYKQ